MIFQLGGMLLLKAPGYRMVEGNSQYVNSYAYSLEKGAQSRKSFYYPMCKLGSSHNPTYYNVGKFKFFFKDFLLCIPFKTCWDTLFSVAFDRPLL